MGVGVKAVTSAADFEQTKVAFTTLFGDTGKAEQTLAQLRQLAAKTPFEFPELADAGRKLIAFGEGPSDWHRSLHLVVYFFVRYFSLLYSLAVKWALLCR